MRTTSKIIVGGYLFMTISTLLYIVVQSRVPAGKIFEFSLANDRIERKELPPFKVFKLVDASTAKVYFLDNSTFTISQSKTTVSSFDIPKMFEPALSLETIGDTLICKIALPDTIKQMMKDHKLFQLLHFQCNLSLPKGSSVFVYNNVEAFCTKIEDVELENLSLESVNSVDVNASDITNFTCLTRNWGTVYVINSTIQNYNLHLDNLISWNIKKSRVGKLNLSSDKQVQITSIPYSMCDEVTYTPKNKDASLSVKLKSPTTLISHDK